LFFFLLKETSFARLSGLTFPFLPTALPRLLRGPYAPSLKLDPVGVLRMRPWIKPLLTLFGGKFLLREPPSEVANWELTPEFPIDGIGFGSCPKGSLALNREFGFPISIAGPSLNMRSAGSLSASPRFTIRAKLAWAGLPMAPIAGNPPPQGFGKIFRLLFDWLCPLERARTLDGSPLHNGSFRRSRCGCLYRVDVWQVFFTVLGFKRSLRSLCFTGTKFSQRDRRQASHSIFTAGFPACSPLDLTGRVRFNTGFVIIQMGGAV